MVDVLELFHLVYRYACSFLSVLKRIKTSKSVDLVIYSGGCHGLNKDISNILLLSRLKTVVPPFRKLMAVPTVI